MSTFLYTLAQYAIAGLVLLLVKSLRARHMKKLRKQHMEENEMWKACMLRAEDTMSVWAEEESEKINDRIGG